MYQTEIQQMMFVFGEVSDPLDETIEVTCLNTCSGLNNLTQLVEELCRAQIVEFIGQALVQAQRRGTKNLVAEDLIFLIRHDRKKTNRLRQFLSWKDVRNDKNKGGAPEVTAVDNDDLMEESGGAEAKLRKNKIKFSWDILNTYSSVLKDDDDDDEDDEDERQAYEDQINRLRIADEITRTMSKEEYMYYSDCRQASFTFKKAKKFKDWCGIGTQQKNSDVIDILGFLACECVSRLTETGLQVKKEWDDRDKELRRQGNQQDIEGGFNYERYLFGRNKFDQEPLQPAHIHEAVRRLQTSSFASANFCGGFTRKELTLF